MTTDVISNISITKADKSRISEVDFTDIKFGKVFSDHMFVADYKNGEWGNLQILPYGKIEFAPSMVALHYGQALFEGMKAYKNDAGEILLFRPEENWKRMNRSAERLCMAEVPHDVFMNGLTELLRIDSNWIPTTEGSALYIRPFLFASEEFLGVKPATEYKFIIFTAPVGAYYSEPVKVKVERHFTRAAEGGVGYAKAAGNYAAALYPAMKAQQDGFHQLVWTDAKEHKYIEEAGTMNIMFVIDGVLITPSLEKKTTLAGITRDSVLTIAKDLGMEVQERPVSVDEVILAHERGQLQDAFGCGTAANIAYIKSIYCNGKEYDLIPVKDREYSTRFAYTLDDIKRGKGKDTHGWVYKV